MALADGVSFFASGGTGPFVFSSARPSFLTLSQAVSAGELIDGQAVSYLAQDSLSRPQQREWGHGTFSAPGNSFARTIILGTVNNGIAGSGAPLNFSGTPIVSLTALAEDLSSPGPFNAQATNANVLNNPNLAIAWEYNNTTDGFNVDSGFPDDIAVNIDFNVQHGMDLTNSSGNSKITFLALGLNATYHGSGQRNTFNRQITDYGTGDCFSESTIMQFAGCNVGSDEGKGFHAIGHLYQQQYVTGYTITAVGPRSSVNATTTASITASTMVGGSLTVQTIPITGTPPAVGDWVVVEQPTSLAPGTSNVEAVLVTAATSNSFSGVFRNNHPNTVNVLPATVLTLNHTSDVGDDRYLVNLTKPTYSTGTISGFSGSPKNIVGGTGTSWSAGMVGGDAHNVGVIAFTGDQVTTGPFAGGNGPLNSYYPISGVNSGTSLNISLLYNFGGKDYGGASFGGDTYTIYQAAKVLWTSPGVTLAAPAGVKQVICEYSAATWSVNDNLELAFGPNPTVAPFGYQAAVYTPGALMSPFYNIQNIGLKHFPSGFQVDGSQTADGSFGFTRAFQAINCTQLIYGLNNAFDPGTGGAANVFAHFVQADGSDAVVNVFTAASANGFHLRGNSSQGTVGTPTASVSFDIATKLGAEYFDSANFHETASIYFYAIPSTVAATPMTTSNRGTGIQLQTTNRGTTTQVFSGVPDYGGYTLPALPFSHYPSPTTEQGALIYVTDSNVASGAITAGSGAHQVLACSNGISWIVVVALT